MQERCRQAVQYPDMETNLFRDGPERSVNVDSFSDLDRRTAHTRCMSTASSTPGELSSLDSLLFTPAEGS
jgi:hypothetical protein